MLVRGNRGEQLGAMLGHRYTGPVDPAGVLMDCSDRGIICMDVHDREVAFGCSDHGVYTYDINSGKKRRTLYTKRCGHSEWVTCLTYVAR